MGYGARSDSYATVSKQARIEAKKERAKLIIEFLDWYGPRHRLRIENQYRYFHQRVPVAQLDQLPQPTPF